MRRAALTLASALLLGGCGDSPDGREPTPAFDGPPKATRIAPGADYAQTHGVSLAEATARLENQDRTGKLSSRLRRNPMPGFSAIWIEHEPEYAVVLAFTGPVDEKAVLALAEPELRPHIVFRRAKRDQATIERDLDRIIAALRPAPGRWSGGYDVKTEKFLLNVEGPGAKDYADRHIPEDLVDDVVVRLGGVPIPLAR